MWPVPTMLSGIARRVLRWGRGLLTWNEEQLVTTLQCALLFHILHISFGFSQIMSRSRLIN